jgi:hypothetical protein
MQIHGLFAGLAFAASTVTMTGPDLLAASGNPRGQSAPVISERLARSIAWSSGVMHIEEIILYGERWEIAGRDREGNEKAVDISAEDGRVLN